MKALHRAISKAVEAAPPAMAAQAVVADVLDPNDHVEVPQDSLPASSEAVLDKAGAPNPQAEMHDQMEARVRAGVGLRPGETVAQGNSVQKLRKFMDSRAQKKANIK